jgi:hypothetical protein
MRILYVTDWSTQRCGIAAFGHEMVQALQADPELEVTVWNANYPHLHALEEKGLPAYMPADAEDYDVVFMNWHPGSCNHYLPQHLPTKPVIAAFLHDLKRYSWCPYEERIDLPFASEPNPEGWIPMAYPCSDYDPPVKWQPGDPIRIGWSGIRGDGKGDILQLCEKYGWQPNIPSERWLSTEEEIDRLALSTVNVFFYRSGQGRASAVMKAVAAQRPIVLSNSPMFDYYRENFQLDFWWVEDLEATLCNAVVCWGDKIPISCRAANLWSKSVARYKELFKLAIQNKNTWREYITSEEILG